MPLLDVFWSMLWFFLWVAWLWILIMVFGDILRSEDLSGWGRGGWALFCVVLPYIGVFTYLVVRGSAMQERSTRRAIESEQMTRAYIRNVAGTSTTTDELAKLAQLRETGALTEEEFQTQKARLLATP